jgi:hypothetical protein
MTLFQGVIVFKVDVARVFKDVFSGATAGVGSVVEATDVVELAVRVSSVSLTVLSKERKYNRDVTRETIAKNTMTSRT